jgi:hypothetical protein
MLVRLSMFMAILSVAEFEVLDEGLAFLFGFPCPSPELVCCVHEEIQYLTNDVFHVPVPFRP